MPPPHPGLAECEIQELAYLVLAACCDDGPAPGQGGQQQRQLQGHQQLPLPSQQQGQQQQGKLLPGVMAGQLEIEAGRAAGMRAVIARHLNGKWGFVEVRAPLKLPASVDIVDVFSPPPTSAPSAPPSIHVAGWVRAPSPCWRPWGALLRPPSSPQYHPSSSRPSQAVGWVRAASPWRLWCTCWRGHGLRTGRGLLVEKTQSCGPSGPSTAGRGASQVGWRIEQVATGDTATACVGGLGWRKGLDCGPSGPSTAGRGAWQVGRGIHGVTKCEPTCDSVDGATSLSRSLVTVLTTGTSYPPCMLHCSRRRFGI